jgi:hypothetical protein
MWNDGSMRGGWRVRALTGVIPAVVFGVGTAACSSGLSAAQQQTAVQQQLQTVINGVNTLSREQGTYAQDVQRPCPANLTPGTFPGYNCGPSPLLTASQLKRARQAIAKAKARLTADERMCQSMMGGMENDRSGKYPPNKSTCEVPLPPVPTDSPRA